jgi:hypothetical protein
MALDPNIALQVRMAPFDLRIPTPIDRYTRLLAVQQMMQQHETSQALEEERRQKAQLAREEAAREASFRGRFKVGQPMPTTTEAYGELGLTGGAKYAEEQRKEETAQQATEKARIENEQARSGILGQIAGGILQANSQEGLDRGVMDALTRGVVSQEEGHQLMGLRWDDPQTRAQVKQIYRRGIEGKEQQAMDIAAAQEGRAEKLGVPALTKAEAEATKAQWEQAAQYAPEGQAAWDVWHARLPPELQAQISPMYSPTERARVRATLIKQEIGKTHVRPPEVQAQIESEDAARVRAGLQATYSPERFRQEQTLRAVAPTIAAATSAARSNIAGLTHEQSQRVTPIANQFDNEPMVKNYNTIAEAGNFVRSLGEGFGGNAGDDQALLYAFAKAMDPGSVVREGEYATVQKYSQSWADTFGFKAARIFSNSPFLSDDARKQMKATIEKKVSSAKTSYENIYNEYGRRIEQQAGVPDGKRFITNYGQAFSGAAPGDSAKTGDTVQMRAPNGQINSVPRDQVEHYKSLGAKVVGQ